jgi:hypothetical protein
LLRALVTNIPVNPTVRALPLRAACDVVLQHLDDATAIPESRSSASLKALIAAA